MQRQGPASLVLHWAVEGVERGLRSHRRVKKQGSGSSTAAPTALSWAHVVSVYRDIAERNLWGTENEASLRLLLNGLVQDAVGSLPEGRGSGVAADGRSSGQSRPLMQAMDVLLPFLQHAPIVDVAGRVEAITAGCLDVIKSANRQEGGQEKSKRGAMSSCHGGFCLRVINGCHWSGRGVGASAGQEERADWGGVQDWVCVGRRQDGEESGDFLGRRFQVACLRTCLMGYPQALKHVVDGLGEIAAREDLEVYVMLARVVGTAEGWSGRGDLLMGSIDAGLEVLLEGLEISGAGGPGQQGGYPPCGILGISGGENDVDGNVTEQSRGIQSFKLTTFSNLVDHLGKLLRALRVLLTSAFPVPVPVPITRIVGLVRRLVVVDITRIHLIQRVGRTSGQVTSLGVGLPGLQVAALDALRCMMGACRGHVVPYMSEVNDLLSGGLEAVLALSIHGRGRDGH